MTAPAPATILAAVCIVYDIDPADVVRRTRRPYLSQARSMFVAMLKRHRPNDSSIDIASVAGIDRCTVTHHVKRHAELTSTVRGHHVDEEYTSRAERVDSLLIAEPRYTGYGTIGS